MTRPLRCPRLILSTAGVAILAGAACEPNPPAVPDTDEVTFTWVTNSTWLMEVGETRILADAFITRITPPSFDLHRPETLHFGTVAPDTGLVEAVLAGIGANSGISHVVVGHGHVDHTLDLGLVAGITGADVIGPRTACLQARAQGLPAGRCTVVEGGEVIPLGPGLEVRVVRWSHSGDPANPRLRLIQVPLELVAVPEVDPETGGLDISFDGGYPNGGGVRAFLFTYENPEGELRWLMADSGNPLTFDEETSGSPELFEDLGLSTENLEFVTAEGAPRDWVRIAAEQEGVSGIDLWIGYGSSGHVRQVSEYFKASAFIPHHWGGFGGEYSDGVSLAYSNEALEEFADSAGIRMVTPVQYLDRFILGHQGIQRDPNEETKRRFGIPLEPPVG